jgi:hypothetical protein
MATEPINGRKFQVLLALGLFAGTGFALQPGKRACGGPPGQRQHLPPPGILNPWSWWTR